MRAALSEFQDRGFDSASMNHIAACAEVSKRTLYKYFPSKSDLFKQAMITDGKRLMERPINDLNLAEDIFSQLYAAASSFTHRFTDPTFVDLARLVVREAIQNETLIENIINNPQNSAVLVGFFNQLKMQEKFPRRLIWPKNFMGT